MGNRGKVLHRSMNATSPQGSHTKLASLTLAALGVVYGDIGTSVLYAMKEIFGAGHLELSRANIFGVLSLLVWTLTVIVSLKYVSLVLRADNRGEGGLVAMLALASESVGDRPGLKRFLFLIGIFGTCLFYGDGVITPAISVLSAVEGLELISPALTQAVLPSTLIILLALFALQRRGTAGIGRFFGPITFVWFVVIAALGIYHIADTPEILLAISPYYAIVFVLTNPGLSFILLGAVVLCVTGGEALYADMGHFGRKPIRLAWFALVMPALVLNYLGQGAILLSNPEAVKNPFFSLAPSWLLLPLVILATVATVIASQALISGAFSVTKQVIQLGYLPRMQVIHTSERDTGQIYIPFVNWSLFCAIVLAVGLFKSSSNLAAAYGIAVTLDMLITTVLTFFVIRFGWHYSWLLCVTATSFFFVVDLLFFASNLLKFLEGGWFPLAIGAAVYLLMRTWYDGRSLLNDALRDHSISLGLFLESIHISPPTRVEGIAVFLTSQIGIVPNALLHNLKHNKVLHQFNLFVTVRNHELPWIEDQSRLEIRALGNESWEVLVNYGFKNDPNLPAALEAMRLHGVPMDPMLTSYFLSRDIVIPTIGGAMSQWREKLFAQMHLNASGAADFLKLPMGSVVELGSKVEI